MRYCVMRRKDMKKRNIGKIYAAGMLVLLLVSFMPLAATAQEADNDSDEGSLNSDSRVGASLGAKVRAAKAARVDVNADVRANAGARGRDGRERVRETLADARAVLKTRLEAARAEQKEAREKFLEVKEALRKQRIDANLSGTEHLERAKAFTNKVIDRVIAKLETLSDRISEKDVFLKEKVLMVINAEIEYYKSLLPRVEAASTRKELQEISKDVRERWAKTKVKLNKYFYLLKNKEVMNVAGRLENFADKVDQRLSRMDEAGYDVTTLQADLQSQVFAKVALAKQNFEKAKEILESFVDKDVEERNSSLIEAQRLLDEAKKLLRGAHQSLKDIVARIRVLLFAKLEGNAGLALGGSAGVDEEVRAENESE